MTDVTKLANREAALEKEKERARNCFVSAMMDCSHVLKLMESGDRPGETSKHSPCRFCGHQGKETCPNGNIPVFELCPHYTARLKSPTNLENEMLEYLLGIHAARIEEVKSPVLAAA